MTKFAFDTCIPVCLHTINYLDKVLQKLEELSDEVYMAHENVLELSGESGESGVAEKEGVA